MCDFDLQNSFLEFCKKNKFEINNKQIEIINSFNKFINSKKTFLNYFFKTTNNMCFYLHGPVGVGKTMLLNFALSKL